MRKKVSGFDKKVADFGDAQKSSRFWQKKVAGFGDAQKIGRFWQKSGKFWRCVKK